LSADRTEGLKYVRQLTDDEVKNEGKHVRGFIQVLQFFNLSGL